MVVAGHIIVFCGLGYDNLYVKNIVMINMPLFLFLNGLVVRKLPVENASSYFIEKFGKIMIPFLAWGVLITIFRNQSYWDFLFDFWKFGYWYLIVLFEFYIIYWILGMLLDILPRKISALKIRNLLTVVLLVLAYFCVRLGVRFLSDDILSLTSYFQVLEYYPYFFLGVVIKQFDLTGIIRKNGSVMMTTLLILTPLVYCLWVKSDSLFSMFILRILCVLSLYVVGLIFDYKNKTDNFINTILTTIGRHTLAIYMIQFYMFSTINFHELYSLLDSTGNVMAIVVLSALSAIVLCYVCILVEKLINTSRPLSSILFGKKYIKNA